MLKQYVKYLILGLTIGISIIISTLIYAHYNRYEYHNLHDGIVFDKLTGQKYSPNTISGMPK